jgi:hypothetical protein
MVRTAVAIGVVLAWASAAAAQGLPEATFVSTKEGCDQLKQKGVAELGDQRDFTILTKTGINAGSQHCDFVTVTARNATSWLVSAFCEEPNYSYPDLFAILQKKDGDLRVTRMTVQQPSYDETEEEPSLSADDLDPSEIGHDANAGGDMQTPDEAVAAEAGADNDSLNTYFRCDSVKP